MGRSPDHLVDVLQQLLAARDVVERMLGVPALEACAVHQHVPVVGLDEDVGVREPGVLDPSGQLLQRDEAPADRVLDHAADPQRLRQRVALDDDPADTRLVQAVEDGAVLEVVAGEQRSHRTEGLRAVVEAARRRRVDEEPVRPGRTGHGREPVVTDGELAGQRVEHRQLVRAEAPHHDRGIRVAPAPANQLGDPGGEARVRDRGVAAAGIRIPRPAAAELLEHVLEAVPGVHLERVLGACGDSHPAAVGQLVPLRALEAVHLGLLAGHGVDAPEARPAQHVVERPVLEHQDEHVLDHARTPASPRVTWAKVAAGR